MASSDEAIQLDTAGAPAASSAGVICVGDVHGNLTELEALWAVLHEHLGEERLRQTTVLFLGDYCDRGPNTRGVLDWLIHLRDERRRQDVPCAPVHFILGNHDFGFAAFIGCLPISGPPPLDLDATQNPRDKEGFWPHPVEHGGMHYQGRRWGALRSYNSGATLKSYGVAPDFRMPPRMREELVAAVPQAHRDFLAELQWVRDEPIGWPPGRLICVHAGLYSSRPAAVQLDRLHARDLSASVLHEGADTGRIAALSGRQDVLSMPPDLVGKAMVVSGHHGFMDLAHGGDPNRVVLDRGAGVPGRPLAAVLLPERTVLSSDGSVE